MVPFDISQVTEDTLPLIYVLLSVIVTGNLIRIVLFLTNSKDFLQTAIKIKDTFTIVFGIIINMIALAFLGITSYTLNNFKAYVNASTWISIGITTLVFGFMAWQYRLHGTRWIKNTMLDAISVILGFVFIILGFGSLGIFLNFGVFAACQFNIACLIGSIAIKIFFAVIVWFFMSSGWALINIKKRRYPKKARLQI